MTTIVKKGTNAQVFRLKSGKVVLLEVSPVLNHLEDKDFDELMSEFGAFIKERVISDKNPHGCFIIQDNREDAKAQDTEVGDEIKDASAPVEVEECEIVAEAAAEPKNKGKRK